MTKRLVYLALVMGVLILGFGALDARAGEIPLPTTLDQLLIPGNFAVVGPEPDTFSNFAYSASPVGSPPAAADVTVNEFHAGIENGITFSGAFFAPPGTTVDYAISYVVTAPPGQVIFDATLSGVFNSFGGTGVGSVGETLIDAATGKVLGTLSIFGSTGAAEDTINFAGVSSILVQKDILLVGGSTGVGISIVNQGFSSTGGGPVIPEPTSMALLGIGMTGLLAFRRFFRRTSVA